MFSLLGIIKIVGGVILGAMAIEPFRKAGEMRFQWKYVAKENVKWIVYGAGALLTIVSGWWLPLMIAGGVYLYNQSQNKYLR